MPRGVATRASDNYPWRNLLLLLQLLILLALLFALARLNEALTQRQIRNAGEAAMAAARINRLPERA